MLAASHFVYVRVHGVLNDELIKDQVRVINQIEDRLATPEQPLKILNDFADDLDFGGITPSGLMAAAQNLKAQRLGRIAYRIANDHPGIGLLSGYQAFAAGKRQTQESHPTLELALHSLQIDVVQHPDYLAFIAACSQLPLDPIANSTEARPPQQVIRDDVTVKMHRPPSP